MKKWKRRLSILCFVFLISTCQICAWAEEESVTEPVAENESSGEEESIDYSDLLSMYAQDEASVDEKMYLGIAESELTSAIQGNVEYICTKNKEEVEYILENSTGLQEKVFSAFQSISANDLGAYKGYKNLKFELVDEDELEVSITVEFENKNVIYTEEYKAFETLGGQLVNVRFQIADDGKNTSLGEKMKTAAMNTIIGIVIVFLMLILISFIISLFAYIPKIQQAFSKSKKKEPKAIASVAVEKTIGQIEQKELVDDLELVAVITAAIAASQNTSTDNFVVKSIKRSKNNNWQKA